MIGAEAIAEFLINSEETKVVSIKFVLNMVFTVLNFRLKFRLVMI